MSTLREAQKSLQARLSYANGVAFALALLAVGMFFITWHVAWLIVGLPLVWVFGITSGAVFGGKLLLNRTQDEDETI